MSDLSGSLLRALESVLGPPPRALHEPVLTGNEWLYVKDALNSTFVSSVGEYVDRLESEIAEYTGAAFAVAVTNGTAALHTALILAGVGPSDEVLIPALSFVATANAVHYCGALPRFVDSSERTLGMDPVALGDWLGNHTEMRNGECFDLTTGRRIQALVPMHTFGHPCEIDALQQLASEYGILMVEDAAESLGSKFQERHTGTFGVLGILSFNGNKIVTCGGGGAIVTDDGDLAARAKHLTTTARRRHAWRFEHDEVGFNYRMPNLNAALGCAQLEQLPSFIDSKRRLFTRYDSVVSPIEGVALFREPQNARSNYWLQTLLLDEELSHLRDPLLDALNAYGYQCRPAWTLLNQLPPYVDCPCNPLPVAESLSRRIINIPSSAGIS
jgi:perosamine synthetase